MLVCKSWTIMQASFSLVCVNTLDQYISLYESKAHGMLVCANTC